MTNRVKLTITTCLGVGFSLLYGGLLASSSWAKNLELKLQDSLVQFRSSTIFASDNILLVSIDPKYLKKPEFEDNNERLVYSKLTKWLLEQKAGLVVLNFPHNWTKLNFNRSNNINRQKNQKSETETSEDFVSSIQNLIKENNNQDHIVLVSPTGRIPNPYHRDIEDYTHFMGSGEDFFTQPDKILNSLVRVQGFFEYENIEGENPSDLSSPARRFYSTGIFKNNIELQSFAWLSLEKYQNNLQKKERFIPAKIPSHIQSNYWQTSTFDIIPLEKLCTGYRETGKCKFSKSPELPQKIRNKIVIVGLTEGEELDVLAMKSPSGDTMPGIEVQANLLSSLMTNSYYQTIPKPIEILIYVLGGIAVSIVMSSCKTRQCVKYLGLGMLGGYGSLGILAFFSGWMIPVVSPIITGIATAISIAIYRKNNQLISENERKKLQIAEEEAIVSQAKKLILRIWSDIHDDPLQELKVAMYQIDFSALSDSDSEPIIDRLSYVGTEIRKYLTVDLDNELTLRPELRQGLAAAIKQHLQQLIDSGTLQLKVVTNLQPIDEPQLNSKWIDAREDAFRFFREAMTNVVCHAQGKEEVKSTATQVTVSLSQEGEQCTLIVENDGAVVDAARDARKKGGMGTKLMAEMAESLPDGVWEREALANGGMRVKLTWQQRF